MFSKRHKDTVTLLQHQTADILGAFTKAIDGLSDVSAEASRQSAAKTVEAQRLMEEAETLSQLAQKNTLIAAKLNDIIS